MDLDTWWIDLLAYLSDGDPLRVAGLCRLSTHEFFTAVGAWRRHWQHEATAVKKR